MYYYVNERNTDLKEVEKRIHYTESLSFHSAVERREMVRLCKSESKSKNNILFPLKISFTLFSLVSFLLASLPSLYSCFSFSLSARTSARLDNTFRRAAGLFFRSRRCSRIYRGWIEIKKEHPREWLIDELTVPPSRRGEEGSSLFHRFRSITWPLCQLVFLEGFLLLYPRARLLLLGEVS